MAPASLEPYWYRQFEGRSKLLALGAGCAAACAVAALAWFTQHTAAAGVWVLAAAVAISLATQVAGPDNTLFNGITGVIKWILILRVIPLVSADANETTPSPAVTYGALILMAAVVLNLGVTTFGELRARRRVV